MTIKFQLNNNNDEKIDFNGRFNKNKFNESKINKSNITEITIGKKVTSLENEVFMDLKQLNEVNFKNSILTHYGYLTFKNCINLNKITDSSKLERLNNSTFRNTGFTTYTCPASLKHMNNYNFKDSIKLKEVNLNNLETLGIENFKNCISLNEVTFSNKLEITGVRTFENCYYLSKVNFDLNSNNLKVISQSSFFNCTGLESIILPKSIEIIGYSAFQNCKGLKYIIIPFNPNKNITISQNAFKNCNNVKNIFLPIGTITQENSFMFHQEIKPNIYFYDPNDKTSFIKGKITINGKLVIDQDKKENKIKINVFQQDENKLLESFKKFNNDLQKSNIYLINDTIVIAPFNDIKNASVSNTFSGVNALKNKSTKNNLNNNNVAIGNNSLKSMVKGKYNIAFGVDTMSNSKGEQVNGNTAIGNNSLQNVTGNLNTAIGYGSGNNIENGSNNILIGVNSETSNTNSQNEIVIGNESKGHGNNRITLGNDATTNIQGKKNSSLGSKNKNFNTLYTNSLNNGINYQLPTKKLDGKKYIKVDNKGNMTLVDLKTILNNINKK